VLVGWLVGWLELESVCDAYVYVYVYVYV